MKTKPLNGMHEDMYKRRKTMFWNKWFHKTANDKPQKPKLKPPVELPQQVGRYLVVNLGEDPDWVWELKAVLKPVEGGRKSVRHFRVYDPVQTAKQWVKVINFHSLDDYPGLILYEGEGGNKIIMIDGFKVMK